MNDIKHLISPFALVPHSVSSHANKATPRPAPPCNCDNSDEENDFGMAPECAFICNAFTSSSSLLGNKGKTQSKHKSKKRGIKHANPRTKRNNHNH
jgi:hypothetical protein